MPTRKEITDAVDARVAELMDFIATTQEANKQGGKYVQLDWSHATDPEDGVPKQADKLDKKLPGKAKTWTDFGYPITDPVANACVHEYVGPQGSGWVLHLSMKSGGKQYVKSIGHGPENRDSDWAEVKPLV